MGTMNFLLKKVKNKSKDPNARFLYNQGTTISLA